MLTGHQRAIDARRSLAHNCRHPAPSPGQLTGKMTGEGTFQAAGGLGSGSVRFSGQDCQCVPQQQKVGEAAPLTSRVRVIENHKQSLAIRLELKATLSIIFLIIFARCIAVVT